MNDESSMGGGAMGGGSMAGESPNCGLLLLLLDRGPLYPTCNPGSLWGRRSRGVVGMETTTRVPVPVSSVRF